MTIELDLFYDRMRKEIMMTSQDASIKVDGEKRHASGEEIPDSSVKVNHSLYLLGMCRYIATWHIIKSDIIHAS